MVCVRSWIRFSILCCLSEVIISDFLGTASTTEGTDASGVSPSESNAHTIEDISPLAELYYPFICAIVSSIILLYCSICIIRTIYKTSTLRNWHYFFVASFLTCDIVFVLFNLIPGAMVSLYAMFNPHFSGISCKLVITSSFPHVAGFFMLVVIAIDNVLRVSVPMNYKQIMRAKLAFVLVGCAWCCSLLSFIPVIAEENSEKTKSNNCRWNPNGRAVTYGIPIIVSSLVSVSLSSYLYFAVLKSWRDVRQCTEPSTRMKLNLTFQGLLAHRKLATNLLLFSIVPMIFGFFYPVLKSLSSAAGGDDFSDSPFLVYVVLPYIGIAGIILRSVLFGFRLHSQVKVWSCKCLH